MPPPTPLRAHQAPPLAALGCTTERARGRPERVFLPAFTARSGDTRRREPAGTGPLAPSGGRAKIGGGARPSGDALPGAYGLFLGDRTSRLSRQGPRPRAGRASPGPLDFQRPRSLGDAPRLGRGGEDPTLSVPVPASRPRATYPAGSLQERGAAGTPGRTALPLPASGEAPGWAGPGRDPDTRPRPAQSSGDPAREPPPGPAKVAGRERDAPGSARSAEAPEARPQSGGRKERCRGGSPLSPQAARPGLPSPAREPPRAPPPACLRPGLILGAGAELPRPGVKFDLRTSSVRPALGRRLGAWEVLPSGSRDGGKGRGSPPGGAKSKEEVTLISHPRSHRARDLHAPGSDG
ncbi:basic salivary proline-rich protein 2-like [Eubalaena glacialis]|uniref:basic salivary proline-rich protein 2-like n=1 Tax=Eubalaena glacialis TaxID=27606 RepID=UPI002A59FA13|nr:basic salivary proline-rich protein 2-like [Eubalaena glacialis]